jgi:hypothetical protein
MVGWGFNGLAAGGLPKGGVSGSQSAVSTQHLYMGAARRAGPPYGDRLWGSEGGPETAAAGCI